MRNVAEGSKEAALLAGFADASAAEERWRAEAERVRTAGAKCADEAITGSDLRMGRTVRVVGGMTLMLGTLAGAVPKSMTSCLRLGLERPEGVGMILGMMRCY